MRRPQSGFTLIELMISVAIIGVLAAIALPAFTEYARHSKTAEAQLALDKMMKNIKVYANQKSALPPSAAKMPAVSACAAGSDKAPAQPKSAWSADPGWAVIQFHMDEPTYYQYQWDQFSPTDGQATASADFDCDNVPAQLIISATIIDGFAVEQQELELVDD